MNLINFLASLLSASIILSIIGCDRAISNSSIDPPGTTASDKIVKFEGKDSRLLIANCSQGSFKVEGDEDFGEMCTPESHLEYIGAKNLEGSWAPLAMPLFLAIANNKCIAKIM